MKGAKKKNTKTEKVRGMYALKYNTPYHVRVETEGEMLNRQENEVMNAVYSLCHEKGICLVSPAELADILPSRRKINLEKLEDILNQLAFDDYFELLSSDRKGEKMYVISLRANGYAYKRCALQEKRKIAVKLLWAVTSAVVAFLVGLLLKRIF